GVRLVCYKKGCSLEVAATAIRGVFVWLPRQQRRGVCLVLPRQQQLEGCLFSAAETAAIRGDVCLGCREGSQRRGHLFGAAEKGSQHRGCLFGAAEAGSQPRGCCLVSTTIMVRLVSGLALGERLVVIVNTKGVWFRVYLVV
nr:hypothetical protein [Tanacetum cinerariifolium]